MAFRVEIAPAAPGDIEETYLYIREQSGAPGRADAWYNGLLEAIFSLEDLPTRCPLASGNEELGREVRQLLYKRHRILFAIMTVCPASRVVAGTWQREMCAYFGCGTAPETAFRSRT